MIMLGHKFALGHFSDDTRGLCGFWEVVPGFRGHTQTPDQAQQSLMCAVASVHSAWSSPWVAWGSQAPWAGFGVSFSVRAAVNTRDTPGDTADSSVLAGLHTRAPGASVWVQLRAHLKTGC